MESIQIVLQYENVNVRRVLDSLFKTVYSYCIEDNRPYFQIDDEIRAYISIDKNILRFAFATAGDNARTLTVVQEFDNKIKEAATGVVRTTAF